MFNRNRNNNSKLIEYMMHLASGDVNTKQIKFMDRKQQAMATLFERLIENDQSVLDVAERLLLNSAKLSNFDVEMNHVAKNLYDFSEELATTGESNMSIVEEVSAGMSQVNEAVMEHAKTMTDLVSESEELVAINQASIETLDGIQVLKEEMNEHAVVLEQHVFAIEKAAEVIDNILHQFEVITKDMTDLMNTKTCLDDSNCKVGQLRKIYNDAMEKLSVMSLNSVELRAVSDISKQSSSRLEEIHSDMTMRLNQLEVHYNIEQQSIEQTAEHIKDINRAMCEINEGTKEINEGLTLNAMDAETIAIMTQKMSDDSQQIYLQAKQIGDIDYDISTVVKDLMNVVDKGVSKISNESFVKHIDKAIEGHKIWMKQLELMVTHMDVKPIQTDATKCAFGHFYHAVDVKNDFIKEEWLSINKIHDDLHKSAEKVVYSITKNDEDEVMKAYEASLDYAMKINKIFERIKLKVEKMASKKKKVFTPAMIIKKNEIK